MAQLQLKNLRKAFGDAEILHGIDLDIRDGEFIVFVGPSGCGKSTLLRCIAGLEDISSGELWIGEQQVNQIPPAKRSIAMVFQSYALYPHMNVAKNMAFGLKLAGFKPAEIDSAVGRAAQILKIEHLLERKPKDLSGGQRQRVAIGRAASFNPSVLIMDEPTAALAVAEVEAVLELIRTVSKRFGSSQRHSREFHLTFTQTSIFCTSKTASAKEAPFVLQGGR